MTQNSNYSYEYRVDGGSIPQIRSDVDTYFFARQLEHIVPISYEVAHQPLNANLLIPTKSSVPPGFTNFTWYQYDSEGASKIIADMADDLPLVNRNAKQFNQKIVDLGDAFSVSLNDILYAQQTGRGLEQELANVCVQQIMQQMNQLAFKGDAKAGLKGWFTGAAQVQVANGVGGRLWTQKTPTEILKDLNDAVTAIIVDTNGVELPDTIAISLEAHRIISTTRMADGTDTTIKEFFMANNSFLTNGIISAVELNGAFTGGANGFIVYKKDSTKFYQEIPMYPTAELPQRRNLSYVVDYWAKYAGVVMIRPRSQTFRYGI